MDLTDEKVAPVAGHPSDEGVKMHVFSLLHVGHTENLDNGLNFFGGTGGTLKPRPLLFSVCALLAAVDPHNTHTHAQKRHNFLGWKKPEIGKRTGRLGFSVNTPLTKEREIAVTHK